MLNIHRMVLTTALLASPLAAQTTIYSTFGPGDSYGDVGLSVGSPYAVAMPFVFGGTSGDLLFDLRIVALYDADITVAFWVGSHMESATQLESWNASVTGGINTFTSVLNPALTNGTMYWLSMRGWEYGAWNLNDQGYSGVYQYSSDDGVSWNSTNISTLAAFDVRVTSADSTVPEPATMTLLATGLAGLAAARRRKQTA